MISRAAALGAVTIAFLIGIIGSLALRPPGAGSEGVSTVSQAQGQTRLHWRVPISSGSNLPVLGENPLYLSDAVRAASNGGIHLEIFDPGEIVPAFAITDAVRDGKVSAGYTWLGYDQGKIPASPLFGAVPFGMEPWEFSAWWFNAGGRELALELYRPHNIHPIYCGMTGPETAGWFRFPIESGDDLAGLKIRFAGIGGKVMERMGASVTLLPAGEIFQALEKGAIDASEFALPAVDEVLGFDRIAKFNYYPGWHQPFTSTHLVINLDEWNRLAAADQALLETACTAAVTRNLASSEASQGAIIAGFPAHGVSARRLPLPVLRQLERAATEVLGEEATRDADFARILASQRRFMAEYQHWKRLAYLPRDF